MTELAGFIDFIWTDAIARSNRTASYGLIVSLEHLTTWQVIASVVLATILLTVVIESWLLVHSIGQSGRVLLRLDAVESKIAERTALAATSPSSADPIQSYSLLDLTGATVKLTDVADPPIIVLFWDPWDSSCTQILDALKTWEIDRNQRSPNLIVISTGGAEVNGALGLRAPVLLDPGHESDQALSRQFGVRGTPSAVFIDGNGRMTSRIAEGSAAVLELVYGEDSALSRELNVNVESAITGVGEPVPQIKLPDLKGRVVDLASLRGKNTLVLFWQSDCGHCRRMLPDLLAWEPDPPPDEPRLVIISSGSVEENLSLGLHAPILVDQRFIAGRTFGASGTPSAVLIDADGRIASRVVDGAPAVLALAGKIHMGPFETTPECETCLADCQNRGGGEACASLCAITGACE